MSGDVSYLGAAVSLVLVVVAAALAYWQRLGLERTLLASAVRALVQLLLVGWVLALIIAPDRSLWWSWGWLALMVLYAADVARRRAPEVPGLMPLSLLAFAVAAAIAFGVLFGLHVFPLQARTLVPLGGLLIGNSMKATVLAARRLIEELRDHRPEVEARLSLGQPAKVAVRPYLRSALRSALTPQIETTKATGLVFLPGAMTGLILAGVAPARAVLVQAVVMFLILAASSTTCTVVSLGLVRRAFTSDHRLIRLPRAAEQD